MQILRKYRSIILYLLVVSILFYWTYFQEQELYFESDFKVLERISREALLWTMGIIVAIILIFAIRKIRRTKEMGVILINIAAVSFALYFTLQAFFLSAVVLLNRIGMSGNLDRKYTARFYEGKHKRLALFYEFNSGNVEFPKEVRRMERLDKLKSGDTVVISFRKGLFGVPFYPEVK